VRPSVAAEGAEAEGPADAGPPVAQDVWRPPRAPRYFDFLWGARDEGKEVEACDQLAKRWSRRSTERLRGGTGDYRPRHARVERHHARLEGRTMHPARRVVQPATAQVLLPDGFDAAREGGWPCLLVLPTEPGVDGSPEQGSGLTEVRRLGFHNSAGCVCASLGFNRATWVADGPGGQHESYLVNVVLPYLRTTYGASKFLLVGMAHSGYAAVSLLMRHPEEFAAAASFDAPLMVEELDAGRTAMLESYETNANFVDYKLRDLCLDEHTAAELSKRGKLGARVSVLRGKGEPEHADVFREVLGQQGIPYNFSTEHSETPTHWGAGWLPTALNFLSMSI